DPEGARKFLVDSRWLGLDPARTKALQVKLERLHADATASMPAGNNGSATSQNDVLTVSRMEYARFAGQTGRVAADCGRNGVFGARRSWIAPGGQRPDNGPVVCVSADDANAYASWLGARERRRYRLPSAGEAKAQSTSPVAGWLTLCGNSSCSKRMVSGKPKPLDANRGYNDVGIRLVREG
ncbi:MAG: SUMF1/EgtB/PvdO family nonheme iron enzyme, partial [Thermomonas sp.]